MNGLVAQLTHQELKIVQGDWKPESWQTLWL